MRLFSLVIIELFVGATVLTGCGNWGIDDLFNPLSHPGHHPSPESPAGGAGSGGAVGLGGQRGQADDGAGGSAAGSGGVGSSTGSGGVGSSAGTGGVGSSAGGGESGGISACGALNLSSSFRLAPAAPSQGYVRCDTLGPEAGWQVTLSPDARRIAVRTAAGTVRLLASDTWIEVAQIASPLGRIDAAAFSPDGASLALLSAEMGDVTIWNADDGSLGRSFAGPPASTIDAYSSSLAFSSDGRRLATSLGTVIDLASGVATDWKTGMPVTAVSTVNPENLGLGEAIPKLAFSAGDTMLFVHTEYQVGNSPTSTRLSLRAPATGREIVLFDMYSRALTGFALSPDGRFVALAKTAEAQIAGFASGLAVTRADTGAQVAVDPGFLGTVLGLSRDGQRLFTLTGSTIGVLATDDLHLLGQFAWPAGVNILGVSPGDELVGSGGGSTSWWDLSTGSIVRTVSHPLDQVTWSGNGRFAAGTGDPAALFYLWSESDGTELCAPPPRGAPAPTLASLGTTLDSNGTATSSDGSIVVTDDVVLHTHSSNWTALNVRAAADGTLQRLFGAAASRRPIAVAAPSGARIYSSDGPDVAVWCR